MPTFPLGHWTRKSNTRNSALTRRLTRHTPQGPPERDGLSEAFLRDKLALQLISRDGLRCYLCGTTNLRTVYEIEHIIARIHGGTDQLHNLALACQTCNRRKRDRIISFRIHDRMPCLALPH